MRFIDLFAGLGGFHVALSALGHECVFASELDSGLQELYERNFGFLPEGDITEVPISRIPKHDILCAGFPCQPFSKAGEQIGLEDARGSLFYSIAKIVEARRPKFLLLENVPNLMHHDSGRTWGVIRKILENELHYDLSATKLSPHTFGTPHLRERMFIVGARDGLDKFNWPSPSHCELDLAAVLESDPVEVKRVPKRELEAIKLWERILRFLPKRCVLPSFPIWSMEFKATYPLDGYAPAHLTSRKLDKYLGSFGQSLHGMNKADQMERLPKYAREPQENRVFPDWKIDFIEKNRQFYRDYHKYLDPFIPTLQSMPPSWQKFEWNCKGMERNLAQLIIQFRGSGIRVKRPNYIPALVASTSTQRPIIGWQMRYITAIEGARLQDLGDIELPEGDTAAFKALGNAVNAKVVGLIAERLVGKVVSSPTTHVQPNERLTEGSTSLSI